jgi:TRAP-type mannitol/chloroaromatic compound transport system permease small subunit
LPHRPQSHIGLYAFLQRLPGNFLGREGTFVMLRRIIRFIDWFIEWEGRISSMLILLLVGIVVYEVIMRYVFNAPTIWAFEATAFVYGLHYMLGLAYTEKHDGHVKVDILTNRLPKRTAAILNAAMFLLIFIPIFSLIAWGTFQFAFTSLAENELNPTSWAPPIYPYKIMMAVAFFFLLLQGSATCLKNIATAFGPEEEV